MDNLTKFYSGEHARVTISAAMDKDHVVFTARTETSAHQRLTALADMEAAALLKLKERLESIDMSPMHHKDFLQSRAKLHGLMDAMDLLGLDRSAHNWIFSL